MRTLFNQSGTAIAYFDDNFDIYSIDGKPLGYLIDAKVCTYTGKHIGWYIDGWIRDNKGYCVFFDQTSTGGPSKPTKLLMPTLKSKQSIPNKLKLSIIFSQPTKRCAWSYSSNLDFFK